MEEAESATFAKEVSEPSGVETRRDRGRRGDTVTCWRAKWAVTSERDKTEVYIPLKFKSLAGVECLLFNMFFLKALPARIDWVCPRGESRGESNQPVNVLLLL